MEREQNGDDDAKALMNDQLFLLVYVLMKTKNAEGNEIFLREKEKIHFAITIQSRIVLSKQHRNKKKIHTKTRLHMTQKQRIKH